MMTKTEKNLKINAEKDKFFSIIAHDLRSPFNGFLGLTELMADGLSHMTLEEIQKTAMLMRNSAANLFRLLGNLLEWSRLQRGLAPFNPATILLMPEISEIMIMTLEAANKKEITISYELPEDLAVFADVNTNRKGTEGEYSTGLGLIICKDLIGKHGGKLWAESEEGKGSIFRFSLPANSDYAAITNKR